MKPDHETQESGFFRRVADLARRSENRRSFGRWLRTRLLVGFLVAFPLVITIFFARFIFGLMDRWFRPLSERLFGEQLVGVGLVVSLLLVLWPAVALAQATKDREAKQMVLMEEYFVFPDKAEEFEALTKEMTGVFATHDFPFRFATYKMDDLRYLGMWLIDGTAGIDALHAEIVESVTEKMTEKKTRHFERGAFLLTIAYDLKRVGERAVNIAERVVFVRTGALEEIDRPE